MSRPAMIALIIILIAVIIFEPAADYHTARNLGQNVCLIFLARGNALTH